MDIDRLSGPKELSQNNRLLRIETALESDTLVVQAAEWVESVNGHSATMEALWARYFSPPSQGLSFHQNDEAVPPALCPFLGVIDAVSGSAHLALSALVGEQVTLSLMLPDSTYRNFHGYVVSAANLGSDNGRSLVRLCISSFTHYLSLRKDSRVFVQQSTRQIIQSVLSAYPQANFDLALGEDGQIRGITTQYGETDAAFVARLVAEEGWNWYLTHPSDGPPLSEARAAKHQLVITDSRQASVKLGAVRYNRSDLMQDGGQLEDTITHLSQAVEVSASSVTLGSWDPGQLAGVQGHSEAKDSVPGLEIYLGSGEREHASHDAKRDLDAPQAELAQERAELMLLREQAQALKVLGRGTVRRLKVFEQFELQDHPRWQGAQAQQQVLSIAHRGRNTLGIKVHGVTQGVGPSETVGVYEQLFEAMPVGRDMVPPEPRPAHAKPRVESELAQVVGWDEASFGPVSSNRDLQVRIQYAWQRGDRALEGGLKGPVTPQGEVTGHAPGTGGASLWVRVAKPSAGANWGATLLPRVGTEVLIGFESGNIDRPVVMGQLHGKGDAVVWPAGEGANHEGVLSGVQSQSHKGPQDGINQWVIDDTAGQLRMRLASGGQGVAWSELSLGYLVSQGVGSAASQRGGWLGSGYAAQTQGWAVVRSHEGMLLSTSAREGGRGSQMDAGEAVQQLQAAQALGQRLNQAMSGQGSALLNSSEKDETQALEKIRQDINPKERGYHEGVEARSAKAGTRESEERVPRFGAPYVVMQTHSAGVQASPGPISSYSGLDTSVGTQGDLQVSGGGTVASVSGQTTSVYNQEGPMRLIAASKAVSLGAHTDALELLADKLVVVQSVEGDIEIVAQKRVELRSGDSKIVLDGGNISYHCNEFIVNSSTHEFSGPGEAADVSLTPLPDTRLKAFDEAFVLKDEVTGQPLASRAYRIVRADGTFEEGVTDALGRTHAVSSVESEGVSIEFLQELG